MAAKQDGEVNAGVWQPQPGDAALILAFAVSIAYANAFFGVFQFDDYHAIVDNPVVHSWQKFFADMPGGIRPLLKLSYTLNWTSGWGPFGFHLFNLLVHLANAMLVWWLARWLFSRCGSPAPGWQPAAALIAALLFALHPVQTEAVTYISGRSTSLMCMFYLASLASYVHGRERGRGAWLYAVSPVLFLLAVATKEVAITLPAALLLWEMATANDPVFTAVKSAIRRQAMHWLMLVAVVAVLIRHPGHGELMTFSFMIRDVGSNMLSEIHGVTYLLSRLIYIHDLNLDPQLPVIDVFSPMLILELVLLGALFFVGICLFRRNPLLGFGILWFFLHLAPTNSVVPRLDVANERQLYLAGLGIFLIAGYWLARGMALSCWRGLACKSVTVALLLTCAIFTPLRNDLYRSEVAMWEDVVAKSPHNARAYNNLGYGYMQAGRHEEARHAFLAALRIKPNYSLASDNLSILQDNEQQD